MTGRRRTEALTVTVTVNLGGNLYHVTSFAVNRITRWRKWMRPETQKQQTAANSRIKTSAAEGVLKILEIYAKATEF